MAVPGIRAGAVVALFPLWFLALAMLLNGLAHPILAVRTSGYFPGLLTAPLAFIMGFVLLRELIQITKSEE
ncbi:MAG TPA: hypothetical protein VMT00_04640 [Thermoanaerobaculia bacterium]|nr:hypothetical protein [Thermoanaerobaculia bacterium]